MIAIVRTLFDQRLAVANGLGLIALVIIGIAMPFSTAILSIGMVGVLLAFILRGKFHSDWLAFKKQPFFYGVTWLFLITLIGLLYTQAPFSHSIGNFSDLFKLSFFFFCFPFLQISAARRYVLIAFTVAGFILLILCNLKYAGLIDLGRQYARSAIFKDYQINALLYSILSFTYLKLANNYPQYRKWFLAIALIFLCQTIFINEGRIGYIYVILLGLYYGWLSKKWKGLLMSLAGLSLLFGLAYQISPNFNQRMLLLAEELYAYQSVSQNSPASLHLRINFAKNTLFLIKERPVFGFGTGSFASTYAEHSERFGWIKTTNPHNYYLLVMLEQGLLGLSGILVFLSLLWRSANSLPDLESHLIRSILLLYGVGFLYNSMWMDYTETLFFSISMATLYSGYASPLKKTFPISALRRVTVH